VAAGLLAAMFDKGKGMDSSAKVRRMKADQRHIRLQRPNNHDFSH